MGATDTKLVEGQTGNTNGTGAASTNTKSTGAGSGRGTGSGAGTTEKAVVPKLVTVDVPGEQKPDEQPKKRGRPPGSTAAKKTAAKPKAKANDQVDSTAIKMLLLTVSGILQSREEMKLWALTPHEVDSIAEPLAAVLSKHNVGEATSEYAEYIALVMSLFIVFVPKYLMWKEQTKQRKAEQPNVRKSYPEPPKQQQPKQDGATTQRSEQPRRQAPSDGTSFSGQLSAFIPAIV